MAQVWDTLLQFEAARYDEALDYLLSELCGLINGTTAFWLGALRVNTHMPGDQLLGWRPRVLHLLHTELSDSSFIKQQFARFNETEPDPSMLEHVKRAGRFRAYLQTDIVDEQWYQSDYYLAKKAHNDLSDRLYIVTPLNEDIECYICVDKLGEQPRFTRSDCDNAAALLRGLGWFQRQVSLSYGLHIGTAAITATERRVLQLLLTESSERQIAAALNLTYNTVHSYVTTIYRKFDVKGRAGLTALWLGQGLSVR